MFYEHQETLDEIAEQYDRDVDTLTVIRAFKHGPAEVSPGARFVPEGLTDKIVRRLISNRFLGVDFGGVAPYSPSDEAQPQAVTVASVHSCDECDKSYNTALKLASHRRVHKNQE